MVAKVREEGAFPGQRRQVHQDIESEVAPLELTLAKVAPLGECNGLAVVGAHRQGVAIHEILRKYVVRCQIEIICFIQTKILGEDSEHVRAALGDVVGQEFNPVGAHERKQCVMPPLKVGPAVFRFDGGELALQDGDKEIPIATSGLQEPGVNAFGLAFDEVEHFFDQPTRRQYLAMVGNAFFGLDEVHG